MSDLPENLQITLGRCVASDQSTCCQQRISLVLQVEIFHIEREREVQSIGLTLHTTFSEADKSCTVSENFAKMSTTAKFTA